MIADMQEDTFDVLVLMGGPSQEREISLLSGAAVADALEEAGHRVRRADITPTDTAALDGDMDVVFIALHGDFGESGAVQQLCEDRGLKYIGSPPRASQLGMDKAASKQIFKRANLATPDWMIVEDFHDPADVEKWLKEFRPPVVVKPVAGGSSLDITICRDEKSRRRAIVDLLDIYDRAMVECFVPGREFTVSILGEKPLPLIEIIPAVEFYDYEAKYADEAETVFSFEHGLDEATAARITGDALKAHRCLGCRDISRVDFILDADGVPQVLELNTIPGFTSHSLMPMAAKRAGIEFPEMCDRIVRMAMARNMCLL
ncbi:MAG: D-alanine--D-alanine ligase [Phycisphaerae bacterium]|nr:D-alanine--D-alanine ligase [Phycisphaerae bacterium]